jgi:hypothetical protein
MKEFKLLKKQLNGKIVFGEYLFQSKCVSGDKTFKYFYNTFISDSFYMFVEDMLDIKYYDVIENVIIENGNSVVSFSYISNNKIINSTFKIKYKDLKNYINDMNSAGDIFIDKRNKPFIKNLY